MNTEYNVEPMGIENWHGRSTMLANLALNRGVKIDGLGRNRAYAAKAELQPFCSFELRVRGSAAG